MRSFPALSYDRGSPSRFTEIRVEEFKELSRRAESRPPHRRSPIRQESPERMSTSAQNQSTDASPRREYKTGVQPPQSSDSREYKVMPRESTSSFNDYKGTVSGNVYNMKVRF